jgi:beta-phosphoglucomutase
MRTKFQAIIFDLDGVIINSEELHARAKRMTLNRFDIPYPENIFNDFKGRPDLDFWSYVVRQLTGDTFSVACLDGYKRIVYISMADELSLIPGVMEFIQLVRKKFSLMGLYPLPHCLIFQSLSKDFT